MPLCFVAQPNFSVRFISDFAIAVILFLLLFVGWGLVWATAAAADAIVLPVERMPGASFEFGHGKIRHPLLLLRLTIHGV